VGWRHEAVGPPRADDVAQALAALDDRGVREAVALSTGYAEVRGAFLALAGLALMQSLGLGNPGSLAGVVVTARDAVGRARSALAAAGGSRSAALRRRADALTDACDLLEEELNGLSRDGHAPVPRALLEQLRGLLARTALVEAGMRQHTSVSCARYAEATHHEHHHHHHHDHGAPHQHEHPSRREH
jgi:hypothetical protein